MTSEHRENDNTVIDLTVQARHTRRATIVVGGVVPFVIAAAAAVVMLGWLPELPDPIAVHWSGAGGPDGYGPALPFILMPLGFVVLFSATMVASAWKLQPSGRPSSIQKFVVATSVWLSAFLSIGIAGTVAAQRGLSDATQAGGVDMPLLIGAVVSLALAAGSWFLLPAADNRSAVGAAPSPLPLAATERVAWSRIVTIAPWVLLIIGITVVLSAGLAMFTLVASSAGGPIAAASLLIVLLAASGTVYWRVSADQRGLTVRSLLGWPRVHIRLDDIAEVQLVEVNPMADFGGWGYRWAGGGRSGVVMRAGEAIEVTRRNGKRFVVTVDDAATAASVLAALSASHRLK